MTLAVRRVLNKLYKNISLYAGLEQHEVELIVIEYSLLGKLLLQGVPVILCS